MAETFSPVTQPVAGELKVPGDKSISHRAIMLGSIAKGTTKVENFLTGEDCLHTIEIFKQFGVNIRQSGENVTIESTGFENFTEPKQPLYFGNSGTTARLMLGILANLPFFTVLHGDPFLTVRPMRRVLDPLRLMGANIDGREDGEYLPLAVRGGKLSSISYELPVKSAQVKSAIILSGLFAEGETVVIEQEKTRDHTENMLKAFGADISVDDKQITISNRKELLATDVVVPGDISSAAFFLIAAAIVPNSNLKLKNVGLNETRTGVLDCLQAMGASITITNKREISGEMLGDIRIQHSTLKATTISGSLIPRLIDEIPIIALLATQAEGTTVIKNAEELRVKETDRIKAVVDVLTSLGANIEETEDGMLIHGKTELNGGSILSYSDHRIAMMGVVASFICKNAVKIDDTSSINISYPTFFEHMKQVTN